MASRTVGPTSSGIEHVYDPAVTPEARAGATAPAPAPAPPAIDVRAIQQALVDAGYPIAVDGKWGPKTQAAYDEYHRRAVASLPQPAQERAGAGSTYGPAAAAAATGGGQNVPGGPLKGAEDVAAIIVRVANEFGLDPNLALAAARQESGLNPRAVGDHGTSFGLFQLHKGGKLGNLTPAQAFDPETNARVALRDMANVAHAHPDWSPGRIAATSQRPADAKGYAASVDRLYGQQGNLASTATGAAPAAASASATAPATTAPDKDPFPAAGTPQQQEDWIRAHYGAMAYLLDDPEIGPILREAARVGWDDGRFTARLQQTHWYQTHNAAARKFDQDRHNDPQDAEQHVLDEAASLKAQAAGKGITLTDARARVLAEQGLTLGWGPGDWDKAIAHEFHYTPGQAFTGGVAATATQMRAEARSYGVNLTDQAIANWVTAQLNGTRTADDFTADLRRMAANRYSYWAEEINAGQTPLDLAGMYVDTLARTYGRNANEIGLDDPDIRAALSFVDPATGKRSEMGDFRFQQYLMRRGSPYWTDPSNVNAKSTALSAGIELGRTLGVYA